MSDAVAEIRLMAQREAESASIELDEARSWLEIAMQSTVLRERAMSCSAAARCLVNAGRKFACARVLFDTADLVERQA